LEPLVQVVQHHAGLHGHLPRLGVEGGDAVQVPGGVNDQGRPDRAPGKAGSRSSGEHREVQLGRGLYRRRHVDRVAGDHDSKRLHLVHGRVGGVERPGERVEAELAVQSRPEQGGELLKLLHGGGVHGLKVVGSPAGARDALAGARGCLLGRTVIL